MGKEGEGNFGPRFSFYASLDIYLVSSKRGESYNTR